MSLYEMVMDEAVGEALHRGSFHHPEDNYVHTQVLEVQMGSDKYVEDNLVVAGNWGGKADGDLYNAGTARSQTADESLAIDH